MKANNKIDIILSVKGLRLSGICDIKNSKRKTYWECQTWMSNKFPFALVGNKVNDNGHEKLYGNIFDNNDAMLDDFVLQPKFKYYDNHEFHKLSKHLHGTNYFS